MKHMLALLVAALLAALLTGVGGCQQGDLRLVDGSSQNEGRVEICVNNQWGTVTDDGWSSNDAKVVCRQLGYSTDGVEYFTNAYFGQGIGSIFLDNVACSGSETSLISCPYTTPSSGDSHSEDAGVRCPAGCANGALRLVGGSNQYEGRVEVCLNNQWGTVSDDGWGTYDARTVCRQLGYSTSGATYFNYAYFGQGSGPIFMDNVACGSSDTALLACSYDPNTSEDTHAEDAGVRCGASCTNGDVRLVGGGTSYEGRVEVCLNGGWGTVCDDLWSAADAQVVCRQLGFPLIGARAYSSAFFGQGSGSILLDDVSCTGTEAKLTTCSYDSHTGDCHHGEDAGVRCDVHGDGLDYYGRDFYIGMFKNYQGSTESARLIIRSSSSSYTPFKVETGDGNTYTSSASSTSPVTLIISSSTVSIDNSYSYRNKGIHVSSTGAYDISVLVVNYQFGTIGDYLAYPYNNMALDRYEYYAVSTGSVVTSPPLWSLVLLVGCEDATTITITPSQTITIYANAQISSSNQITVSAGNSHTILLNQMQTYLFGKPDSDMSGTKIVSNKPLTVISGHECGNVPSSTPYCEHLTEQMLPTVTWGKEFLLAPYGGRNVGQYYKVVTSQNSTTFSRRCGPTTTTTTLTSAGSSSTFQTTSSEYCSIVSDNPITINQLGPGGSLDNLGDPIISTIPAIDQYYNTVYFTTLSGSEISHSYISITVTASQFNPNSILLNNQPASYQWQPIYNSTGSVVGYGCTTSVSAGTTSTVHHAGPGAGLAVLVYGFNYPQQGYGYIAGVTYPIVRPDFGSCFDGDVQLVGGMNEYEGRVEVCVNNTWGTVCDDDWGSNDAAVTCGQLGYSTSGVQWFTGAYFGQGSGPILLDDVNCGGSEKTLLSCSTSNSIGQHNCNHGEDAGVRCPVACEYGQIQLVGGLNEFEGRVEICIDNQWGTVCDDGWGTSDAQVVCTQLGISSSSDQALSGAYFGQGSGPIFLDNVACSGTESTLLSCSSNRIGYENCGHYEDASVRCSGCTNGALRLWSSYSTTPLGEGMLQICVSNTWYVVCDDYWGCSDAVVACRQLGYNGTVAQHLTDVDGIYGYFSPLWPYRYDCTGSEDSLQSCSYSYYSGCSSLSVDSAGVRCTNSLGSSCTDGQLQLAGGQTSNEGRLEYCNQGQWSPFCSLDDEEATVACKQLGHTAYPWAAVLSNHSFGLSGAQSTFQYFSCSSSASETSLSQCSFSASCYVGTCYLEYGIRCYEPEGCLEGSVRLSGGDIEQEGIPEVCVNGVWGSICDVGWSSIDGLVLCRELGYDDIVPTVYSNSYFGDGEGPIVWSYLSCSGLESSISQCSRLQYLQFSCSRNDVAGIFCRDDCSNGDVRLTGGHSDSDGTVEICYGNIWGLIEVSGWGENDAIVICRQLGFPESSVISILNSSYERPNRTVHLTYVQCSGNEESINVCSKTSISLAIGKTTYRNSPVVAVDCSPEPPTEPTCLPKQGLVIPAPSCSPEGSVRLADGTINSEGRLEYCYTGKWSPFCTLDFSAASVACKQLGYIQYTGAAVITDGTFGSSLNYSLFENITCSEDAIESSLASCTLHSTDCLPLCPNNTGIRCFNPGNCEEGTVQLADGIIDLEGRVEVCHDGVWGSICDAGWDKTDAHIICQQLGYAKTVSIAYHYSYFGAGNGPIIYSDVDCGGWEDSFSECSKISFPHFFCLQSGVAGLLCGYDCEDGDIQLVGGSTKAEGTVQVCFNSQWGLISESGWSQNDAQVVCRELGFLTEGAIAVGGSAYSKPNLTIHLSNVYCTGSEQNVAQCMYTFLSIEDGKALLDQVEVAGVFCQQPDLCVIPPAGGTDCFPGDVRLTVQNNSTLQVNSTITQGNLEYCYKGLWSSMCSISESVATVACKQMGFTSYSWASIYNDDRFILGSNSSFFENLVCSEDASEANLTECALVDACTSICNSSTVGIQCYEPGECLEGSVRLAGGDISQEGRLEVCLGGVWGSVCGDGWDQTDAYTLCQQLDMGEGEPTLYSNSEFGDGEGPIVLSDIECGGWETDIFQCSSKEYLSFSCLRNHTAGVLCRDLCTDGEIRLTGGQTENEGTVQICFDNLWGLVAQNEWSTADAEVTCRQLGYPPEGAQALLNSYFGKPDRTLHLSSVVCTGPEDKLTECSLTLLSLESGKDTVQHVDVAGVSCRMYPPTMPPCDIPADVVTGVGTNCTHGNVRLVDGQMDTEGRLEMCFNSEWTPLCDIDESVALVACKQLGYTQSSWAAVIETGEFGKSLNYSLISNISCSQTSTEYMLTDCTVVQEECLPACSINAGIRCFVPESCDEGSFRLVSGIIQNEGEIEACINGVWGSICADEWDETDAYVICKQLGFIDGDTVAFYQLYQWDGLSPIIYSDVRCAGWENTIEECDKKQFLEFSCSKSMVAGALCGSSCDDGDIRLSGGSESNGTLEICFNSIWGLISVSGWGEKDAEVTCSQLGFLREDAIALIPSSFGKPNLPIQATDVYCIGDESKLTECPMTIYSLDDGKSLLNQADVVGVSCQKPKSCESPPTGGTDCSQGDVRLTGGKSADQGNLEFCSAGVWSPFCMLGTLEASVSCQQLGHLDYTWASVYNDEKFSSTVSNYSLIENITCSGTVTSLADCNVLNSCITSCENTIGIKCYEPGNCTENAVRLADGAIDQEGRLEICINGVWGSFCSDGWDQTDAYVLCKQLQLGNGEPTIYMNSKFGDGEGPIVFSQLACIGWERNIIDCSKSPYGSFSCPRPKTAGILCHDLCTDGDVRLTGGKVANEGTVEVCLDSLWGLVNDIGWGANDATVICRQLGYPPQGASPLLNSYYGKPNRTLHLESASCTGLEGTLLDCNVGVLSYDEGKMASRYVDVAGVSCLPVPPTSPPCEILASSIPGGADCTHGTVQLQGGQSNSEGRLEFCFNGLWSPFCSLDDSTASVACKQLGFTQYTWAAVISTGEFGMSTNFSLFNNITCSDTSTEYALTDCTIYSTGCLPTCDINMAIRCFAPISCEEGAIRLVNGVIEHEGKIEICINGMWGSICPNGWDDTDAYVVCKQLGYAESDSVAYSQSYEWDAMSPIIYSYVRCGGWEDSLDQCGKTQYLYFTCTSSTVAGTLCGYSCDDGDVQLVDGGSDAEGTVEVCLGGLWGLVTESGWGVNDAEVTCKQLGFLVEGAVALTGSTYGKPSLPVHWSEVYCTGDENKLTECTHKTYSLDDGKTALGQVNVAGVSCQKTDCETPPTGGTECTPGDTQLVGGNSNGEGDLQYCYKGMWSSFCTLGESEALVACKQFGFTSSGVLLLSDGRYPTDTNGSLFDNITCSDLGYEPTLSECVVHDSCTTTCSSTIGIKCFSPGSCEENSVRLSNGDIDEEGQVEICSSGLWGSVCSSGWDLTNAYVLCRQMGFSEKEPKILAYSLLQNDDSPLTFSNFMCQGWEESITECTSTNFPFTCDPYAAAGVFCYDDCDEGDIHLVGGSGQEEGVVVLCMGSLWGMVAYDEQWDEEEAHVLCSQLGYEPAGSKATNDSQYLKPKKTIIIENVQCLGTEKAFVNCFFNPLSLEEGKQKLADSYVAGVSCMKATSTPLPHIVSTPTSSMEEEANSPIFDTNNIIFGVLGSTTLIGIILLFVMVAIVCYRKKLHGKRCNEYEPDMLNLHPVASRRGVINPMAVASEEEMEKMKEIERMEESETVEYHSDTIPILNDAQ